MLASTVYNQVSMSLAPVDFLSGEMQVSPPAVKLQNTLMVSPIQPWFGSIQYSPKRETETYIRRWYDEQLEKDCLTM